jgi:uncharacterized protein YjgD (DUF1641 family)
MAKEEKRIENRDGIEYFIEEAKSGGQVVGLAPVRKATDLDELLEFKQPEEIFKLAYRQYTQDLTNRVRAMATKDSVSDAMIVSALANRSITVDAVNELMKKQNLSFTASAKMLLSSKKPSKDEIYWSIAD